MTRKKLENVILCAVATAIVLLIDKGWCEALVVGIATGLSFRQGQQDNEVL